MSDESASKRCRAENTNNRHSDITNELRQYAILDALDVTFLSTVTVGYVFNNGDTALLTTSSGDVYGVSSANDTGADQEAADDGEQDPVLERIGQLSNRNVDNFMSSDKEVFAITLDGKELFYCDVKYCVDFDKDTTNTRSVWMVLSIVSENFIQVAMNHDKTLLLTQKGEILCWDGGLSNGVSSWFQLSGIKNIASRSSHSWVLSMDGWLQKLCFQQQNSSLQKIVSDVSSIECGDNHVIALSNKGVVYTQGQNNNGQLGSGKDPYVYTYTSCNFTTITIASEPNIPVVCLAAFKDLSAAQTVTGKVYVWGKCFDRVLATPTETYITRLMNVFPILAKMLTTPKPIKSVVNKEEYYSVKHSIAATFNDVEDSDITFQVGGKTIHAHKFLLKNRCEHFKVMFCSQWKECITGVIEIKNFSYEVYRAFLYYLYSDELDISYEDAVEMLDLAQSYGEEGLKLRCERVIEWWICDSNAATIFQLAVKYQCSKLQESCAQYGVSNMKGIALSAAFQEIETQIARDFVVRTAKKGGFLAK